MTKLQLFTAIVVGAFILLITFNIGFSFGRRSLFTDAEQWNQKEISLKVKDSIALRYFDRFGVPETDAEICDYEVILYGKCDL